METSLILTVSLAAALMVVVLILVCVAIYYRWRLGDKNATLGRFLNENAELHQKIRRTGILIALICMTTASMAQTIPAISSGCSDRFPKLPSLKADFCIAMATHNQPDLLKKTMDTTDLAGMDNASTTSIMFLHKNKEITSHFQYKSKRYLPAIDGLVGLRDRIVRKRRFNEGHPLPPPTPVLRRR